jgi:hypothetical protein
MCLNLLRYDFKYFKCLRKWKKKYSNHQLEVLFLRLLSIIWGVLLFGFFNCFDNHYSSNFQLILLGVFCTKIFYQRAWFPLLLNLSNNKQSNSSRKRCLLFRFYQQLQVLLNLFFRLNRTAVLKPFSYPERPVFLTGKTPSRIT